MCCKNDKNMNKNKNNNNNNNNNNNSNHNNSKNSKNKSGFEQFGSCEAAQKLRPGALTHTFVLSLAAPNLSTHCHVSFRLFSAFSACDSIHKHPCLMVMPTRMFAIFPPLSRYPQHSALLRGLDHTFGLSLLLWALSFPTVPTRFKPALPTQTPQLDSHEMSPTRRALPVCEALQCFFSLA